MKALDKDIAEELGIPPEQLHSEMDEAATSQVVIRCTVHVAGKRINPDEFRYWNSRVHVWCWDERDATAYRSREEANAEALTLSARETIEVVPKGVEK